MTQLFSTKYKRTFVVLFVLAILCSYSFIKINENPDPFDEVCKNADAYFEYAYTDVTYVKSWSKFKKYTTISNKMVINNKIGVDEYAFLRLSDYETNHLSKISVKTLKANGAVVELDSATVLKKDTKTRKFSAVNYPIPAVEPGDTILTSYTTYEYLNKYSLKDYVGLHNPIPNKDSQYSIKSGTELRVKYKQYNKFPKPQVVNNDSIIYLQFSMKNVKGFQENDYSCLPCELPYVYYALETGKKNKNRLWKDVYNEEFNVLSQPIKIDYQNATYYKRWKRRTLKEARDSSKYKQLEILVNEVVDNYEIVPLEFEELIKTNGYFLKEKKFNTTSLYRFYRQLLEDLDIKYWAVFAKSKRLGEIDDQFIRKGEFDHIFFAYQDENNTLKFLYPHSQNLKYQIDEFPTNIYNSTAILVRPIYSEEEKKRDRHVRTDLEFAQFDSISVSKITLPGVNPKVNRTNQLIYAQVDLENKKTNLKSRFTATGGLSTEIRATLNEIYASKEVGDYFNAMMEVEEENAIEIDTVIYSNLNKNRPFSFTMNSVGKLNKAINFVNPKMLSLSIDKLIAHTKLNVANSSPDLDYYIDFAYSDYFSFYLNFPKNIQVLGLEDNSFQVENDYLKYTFNVTQSKENQLKLNSVYTVKKDFIPKSEYENLKSVHDEIRKKKNKSFLIKVLD